MTFVAIGIAIGYGVQWLVRQSGVPTGTRRRRW